MDAAMCSRGLICGNLSVKALKKILNHPFEVIIPGAEDTEGIAIQGKSRTKAF
jgi:hypothetical protein